MKHFLVIFDRTRGKVLKLEEFADRANALRARFKLERSGVTSDSVEIVILGAESAEAIRRTHSRYFETAADMARAGAAKITSS